MKCGEGNVSGLRFTRKTANENERAMISSWWQELTNLYGTYVDYFTYDYSLTGQDAFYGEQPLAPFTPPKGMIMLTQFNNDTLLLSKFGIQTNADVTFIVPIQQYREAFNSNTAEPKSGDLIRLTELGWDRPGGAADMNTITVSATGCNANNPLNALCADGIIDVGPTNCTTDSSAYSAYDTAITYDQLTRGAPVYEITERRDENLTMQYNVLQGHYVWILHARKFDYSYQPNAPREPGSDQVSDETLYGKLSGGTAYPEEAKKYPENIDGDAKKNFNYDKFPSSDTSVYGGY